MRLRILTVLFVLASTACSVASAQQPVDNSETVVLPDGVMEQVISRILRYQFKPSRNKKTIPVADIRIKPEWLPSIDNITFQLVPEREMLNYGSGVFLIEEVEQKADVYSINVGWGDLDCDASGTTWKFAVNSGKVRLWPTSGGWGRGCGGNGPPLVRDLKLGEVSPNELRGYEFFTKGKLKNIRLGLSTREDMKRLFGDTCEGPCDYDGDWYVWVNYFDENTIGTKTSTNSDGIETETEVTPKNQLVGKLRFLRLTPKKSISFARISLPRQFVKNQSYSIGDAWGLNGFEGAVHSTIDTYTDGYGLRYEVFDKETFNNLSSKSNAEEKQLRKGDLVGIEYEIPNVLDDSVYVQRVKRVSKK